MSASVPRSPRARKGQVRANSAQPPYRMHAGQILRGLPAARSSDITRKFRTISSYRRRLRRITAAPCPFGSASVADSWARAWPSYRASCSPSRFGKTSGNAWGSKKRRRGRIRKKEEEEEEASWAPLGALLGPPGSFLGASWRVLGGLGGLLGGLFGRLRAFLACLTPSEAVLGACLGRLGALLGHFRAVLEAILGVLEASWAVLGPSWGRLGGLLGRHGAILEASWAILGRSWGLLGPS